MIRFFDIFFSSLALLLLSPLFFVLIIILKFSGEGEIFYLQKRVGLHERKFSLCKFVTMTKNSPLSGSREITIKDDPRILPVGKMLRKTKINELPQLFNILIGDMSLVGPRPLALSGYKNYPESQKFKEKEIYKKLNQDCLD